MFDFDPRYYADERDHDHEAIYDSRWGEDVRERDERERELDPRDRDPRDPFVHRLDLPHGLERELVQDERERLCEFVFCTRDLHGRSNSSFYLSHLLKGRSSSRECGLWGRCRAAFVPERFACGRSLWGTGSFEHV